MSNAFLEPPHGAIFNASTNIPLRGPNGERVRQLRVAGAGNLELVMSNGSTGVITGVVAGELITGLIEQINSAGTTATGFTAFY